MTESEPQNRRLGYARVSTYGQTLDTQIVQLRAEGCAKICQIRIGVFGEDRVGANRLETLRMYATGPIET